MANIIRIKRSAVSQSPATLQDGELAYSSASGNLFVGTAGGTAIEVVGGAALVTKMNTISTGATPNQTPTQILNALKTVDGSGSLLDADTLDGLESTQFALKTDLTFVASAEKGQPNGVATLDVAGKIPTSQIPAVAITSTTVTNSQAQMLALGAQQGDVVIRSDLTTSVGNVFIKNAGVSGTVTDWTKLDSGYTVSSVNGQTGTIVLNAVDVGADPVGTAATAVNVVQAALTAHKTAVDPHGIAQILIHYVKDSDNIDGGTF